jgi:hypothetical protein
MYQPPMRMLYFFDQFFVARRIQFFRHWILALRIFLEGSLVAKLRKSEVDEDSVEKVQYSLSELGLF